MYSGPLKRDGEFFRFFKSFFAFYVYVGTMNEKVLTWRERERKSIWNNANWKENKLFQDENPVGEVT